MVDAGDDARYAVLGLGEQGDHEIDLVVAGRGYDHLALGESRLLERGDLARICDEDVCTLDDSRTREVAITVNEEHLMAVADELTCDGATHLARTCDGDAHQISSGPVSNTDSTESRFFDV